MNVREFLEGLKLLAGLAFLLMIGGFAFGAGVALYIKWVVH